MVILETTHFPVSIVSAFLFCSRHHWYKVFKSELSKFCRSLKKISRADHIPRNFLKTVFHKIYLVHSWILCPNCHPLVWEELCAFLIYINLTIFTNSWIPKFPYLSSWCNNASFGRAIIYCNVSNNNLCCVTHSSLPITFTSQTCFKNQNVISLWVVVGWREFDQFVLTFAREGIRNCQVSHTAQVLWSQSFRIFLCIAFATVVSIKGSIFFTNMTIEVSSNNMNLIHLLMRCMSTSVHRMHLCHDC